MGILTILLTLIYTGVCVFLILVILLQAGKGGGLSGLMGGGGLADSLGATGAEKTLNRWTTYCAVGFFVLSIVLTIIGGQFAHQNILSGVTGASMSETTQSAPPSAITPESTTPTASAEQPAPGATAPAAATTGTESAAPPTQSAAQVPPASPSDTPTTN